MNKETKSSSISVSKCTFKIIFFVTGIEKDLVSKMPKPSLNRLNNKTKRNVLMTFENLIKIVALTNVVLLSACSKDSEAGPPVVENLNTGEELDAEVASGMIVADGEEISLDDYWNTYCVTCSMAESCMKMNKAVKIASFHAKSVTGQN